MIRFLLFLLATLMVFAGPARAQGDDVGAAARGVVRVVVIATEDGEVVDFGHGSGFAVAPNRIVTNAHVVALAAQYPKDVVIGIVPWQGLAPQRARLVAFDERRDLALLEMQSGRLPPVSIFTGTPADGTQVAAVGYPGNVDLATAQSWQDYVRPVAPTRSTGNFSNVRVVNGIPTLLHTAAIARGNSGGPLFDGCGRVLGVNTLITRQGEGDAPFFFAVANSELTAFLRQANQPFNAVTGECVSMAERMRADRDRSAAEARALEDREEAAARQREERLALARVEIQEARDNGLALAALMLALSVLAFGGAGVLYVKNQPRAPLIAAGAGGLLLLGAIFVYLMRPSLTDAAVQEEAAEDAPAAVASLAANNTCRLVPDRSRITVSAAADVPLAWASSGCVNGRTQYAQAGDAWTRILVPNDEATVSVLEVRPGTSEYSVSRYMLDAPAMTRVRALRRDVDLKTCTNNAEARTLLAEQQRQIADILPAMPNERLVYRCEASSS